MIRVLIADDELYFRNYMLTAVDWHSLGFQVCSLAQNGEEVLSELSKNTINIVFLDINMPHINGLTLAKRIKNEYPHIMIVFITGYSDFSFTRKAIQLQVEDYMLKPISPDELSELLQTLNQKYKQKQQENIRKKKLHDFTLDNYMSVSYTHLDVYKRQIKDNTNVITNITTAYALATPISSLLKAALYIAVARTSVALPGPPPVSICISVKIL